jgi:hypothetical protein
MNGQPHHAHGVTGFLRAQNRSSRRDRIRELFLVLIVVVCTAMVLGCSRSSDRREGQAVIDPLCEQEMKLVASRRILFGHQSVGRDILAGLTALGSGATRIEFKRPDAVLPSDKAFFAECAIGANGDPVSKCKGFGAALDGMVAVSPEVAFMKFCYVDVTEDSDVAAVLAAYAGAVEGIRSRHPNVRLVHVTVPLTTRSPGWKRFVNRVLGRGDAADIANIRRAQYNEALRTRYAGEPLFDLAAAESTLPGGERQTFDYNGATGYALAEEYTTDGGHLNAHGQVAVARELVRVLAALR